MVENFAEALNPCSAEWAALLAEVGNGIDDPNPAVASNVAGKEVSVVRIMLRHPPIG